MLKKSLFVSIFLLLFIGLSDYGYACHDETGKHNRPGTPCGSPAGGNDTKGGEVGEYTFTFSKTSPAFGGLAGHSNDPWLGGGNETNIGRNHGLVAHFTDLTFFQDPKNAFGAVDGANCFPNAVPDLSGHIRRWRGGIAESQFFFTGATRDGGTVVQYNIQFLGTFLPDAWPLAEEEMTTVKMTHWITDLSNAEADVKRDSCIGEFDVVNDDFFEVEIDVFRCLATGCP